ncbi:hypothetical protein E0Z10_g10006 [Xylaria hypoxylon]|uniref:AMP-dependent synthetase/ligase domain-containing protein n=1 Tax=Xylaria hypoxylon TaxID=37992 RepID=A0A4Z0YIJ7_9PEZI|nr:hypothetical protein E0Z10_g10006 [Xylaria hypoxylon]
MSGVTSRLKNILGHLGATTSKSPAGFDHTHHLHQLSPTFFLERAAAIEPDAEAIYHVTANGKVLRRSYGEFADAREGCPFLESIFGVIAAGGVLVPVNYRLKSDDVNYIFDFAEVDSIIVDQEYLSLLDDFKKTHPNVRFIIDLDTDATEGLDAGPFDEAVIEGLQYEQSRETKGWPGLPECTGEDDMVAIPFTSGTTARPKGCVYTHRGAGITHFNAAPTVNTLLCASNEAERLPNPVHVTVAASPPTSHLLEQMTKLNLIPVHVYGMTETYGPITKGYYMPAWDNLPSSERYAQMARQGHGFVMSLAIRVVKPELAEQGVLVDVARDGKEIGEIVFCGNICAKGYYKDPEATKKLFAGSALHSGDLAVMHPDGSTQIQDRAKDIIISGGENISSVALESMLVQHPGILEAGVVGVPDEQWGERVKAYLTVKVKDGQHAALAPGAVIDWAKNQSTISRFMVPKEVEIVDDLPKTSTGKIQKNVLREWAKKGKKIPGKVPDA